MKIVNLDEFLRLPPGTIYSAYEPCICRGLFRKDETCPPPDAGEKPIDFYHEDLLADVMVEGDEEPKVMTNTGKARWAEFDRDAQFAICEAEDLAFIVSRLTGKKT